MAAWEPMATRMLRWNGDPDPTPVHTDLSVEPPAPEELVPRVGLQEVDWEALGHTAPHNRTDGLGAPWDKDLVDLPVGDGGCRL